MNIKQIGSLLLLAWPAIGLSEIPERIARLENYSAENGFNTALPPLTKAAQKTTVTKHKTAVNKEVGKTTAKQIPKRYSLFTKRQVHKKRTAFTKRNSIKTQKQTVKTVKAKKATNPTQISKGKPKAKAQQLQTQVQRKPIDPNIILKQCASSFKAANFSKALLACQKAAEQNDSNAQFNLAKMYSTGLARSEPDYVKALQYASLAANQNHAQAQFLLALCYQNGIGVTQDSAAAINWYQQAVLNGLANAVQFDEAENANTDTLANISWPGANEYKAAMKALKNASSRKEAVEQLAEAAQMGHPLAEYQLAKEYLQGENIAQDDAKAIEWFTKSAEKNHHAAQSYLAWMNLLGLGVKPNNQAAINWFLDAKQISANQDIDASLQEKLNQLTSQTLPTAQPSNVKQRQAEFSRGVVLIETSSQAHPEALRMVAIAAEKDMIPAQLYLATLYEKGEKVPQDIQKSTDWYLRAATAGNADAQYAMGWHYYHGQGVPQSKDLALKCFHQASVSGDIRAKNAESFLIVQQIVPKVTPATPTLGNRIKEKVNANVHGIFKAVGLNRLSGYEIFARKS